MPSLRGLTRLALLAAPIFLIAPEVHSQTSDAPTAAELAAEIKALKQDYETRIRNLEAQLEAITTQSTAPVTSATSTRSTVSAFNPAIGVILNAAVSDFSAAPQEIPGFQLGHESQRGQEGLALIGVDLRDLRQLLATTLHLRLLQPLAGLLGVGLEDVGHPHELWFAVVNNAGVG